MELLRPEHIESEQGSSVSDQGAFDQKSPKASGKKSGKIRRILRFPFKTRRRKIISFFIIFLLVLLILFLIVIPALVLYPKALALRPKVDSLQAAWDSKDLSAVETSIAEFGGAFTEFEDGYSFLSYLQYVPFVGQYYLDGSHLLNSGRLGIESAESVVTAIEPYGEVLGFKGDSGSFGDQITVEQQLANLLDTLPNLTDDLDEVWENLINIQSELSNVDPARYPQEVRGMRVRFWLEEAQSVLTELEPIFADGQNFIKLVPKFLGSKERTYLVLFQNDAEIRSTGGFITAISLLTLKDGRVIRNEVHDVTYVAGTFGKTPTPLGKYLGLSNWSFRDGNYSPDFPTAAKQLLSMWKKAGFSSVSGIIAINTEAASRLLELTGPINLPPYTVDLTGYALPDSCKVGGRDFTSENLVCRLEYYVEKNPFEVETADDRKAVLKHLSDAAIQKITTSSGEIWPKLIDLVFEFLEEKNLMAYMVQSDEQAFVKNLGYTGEMREFEGDYLHISDNNFGGRRTDMFMTQQVEQTLKKLENGTWRKTVSIKYYNPQKYDNWVSAVYRDFVRLYVPKGSKLVSINGANEIWDRPDRSSKKIQNPVGWSEFGKTVFGAFFNVEPQKERTLIFSYDLPEGTVGAGEYEFLMQKQSGTNIGLVEIKIDGNIESFDLTTDTEITLPVDE